MLINEPDGPSQADIDHLTDRFRESDEFPVRDAVHLEMLKAQIGQKGVYRALVEARGREETAEVLGTMMNADVVRMQLNVLCPVEPE